ncbi:MAG: XdhC family protein [Anaerolineae bacterium]|nr:XdhC family protein [Anaerolineae bacterium]
MDDVTLFGLIHDAQAQGQDIALATVVRTQGSVPRHAGSKMVVWPDGQFAGTVGGGMLESRVIEAALEVIASSRPEFLTYQMADMDAGDVGVCGGTVEVFVEPILPAPTVLVIGCGHVGKEVAALAKWLGYRVFVSDDREDLCSPEQIPGMDAYYPVPARELTSHVTITSQTYIAAMTRGQIVDLELLPPLVSSPARYIGLIGSKRRWALTAEALREQGMTDTQLARVYAPVGLELEAETPREIAVSVLAEIIMVQHGGSGEPMRWYGREGASAGDVAGPEEKRGR